jgi:hypothetical protein
MAKSSSSSEARITWINKEFSGRARTCLINPRGRSVIHASGAEEFEKNKSGTAVAQEAAEKCAFRPSGVKTPEESADFMSCLKARPTTLESFSATCKAELILMSLCRG